MPSRIHYVRLVWKENQEIYDPETGELRVVAFAGWRTTTHGQYLTLSSPEISDDVKKHLAPILRDYAVRELAKVV